MAEIKELTPKCAEMLTWLRDNDNGEEGHFATDIAAALGVNPVGIHGIMNALVKRELVVKGKRMGQGTDKEGNVVEKEYTTYALTDAGRTYQA